MDDIYESDELLNQYLLFHYGSKEQLFPYSFDFPNREVFDFPVRCALEGLDFNALKGDSRALDLGCAVGRSSFELTKHFKSVLGIDYSQAFIESAQRLKNEGSHPVERLLEGHHTISESVSLDASILADRVNYEVGDAMHLREDLGDFDAVLACNLICRLSDPMALINRFSDLVRPGGQLFITTPFTWLKAFTPEDRWLNAHAEHSFSGLVKALEVEGRFKLIKAWDMPFLIREHSRKFQFSVAQASRWERLED